MSVLLLILVGLASVMYGIVTSEMVWIYVAIAASGLGLSLLMLDGWRKRRAEVTEATTEAREQEGEDPFESGAFEPGDLELDGESGVEPDRGGVVEPTPGDSASGPSGATGTLIRPAPSASGLVVVVPGGRRYHRATCALAGELDTETLTLREAADEGFTPCTKCAAPRARP